jgi:predicted DNA binding protein
MPQTNEIEPGLLAKPQLGTMLCMNWFDIQAVPLCPRNAMKRIDDTLPCPDNPPLSNEMTVIADISVSSEDFVLGRTMQAVPGDRIELEQLVPSGNLALPYFWIEQTNADAVEEALNEQATVDTVTQADALDGRILFRIEWTDEVDSFLENLVEYEAAVLEATGTTDEWQFQIRFRSYEILSEFYRACIDDGVGVGLDRVHNPVEAASRARFGLTDDQEETLVTAFEAGYFSIPRDTTIRELGEALGVSDSAVSQRLRRGESSLIAATLLTASDTSLSGHRE